MFYIWLSFLIIIIFCYLYICRYIINPYISFYLSTFSSSLSFFYMKLAPDLRFFQTRRNLIVAAPLQWVRSIFNNHLVWLFIFKLSFVHFCYIKNVFYTWFCRPLKPPPRAGTLVCSPVDLGLYDIYMYPRYIDILILFKNILCIKVYTLCWCPNLNK